MYNMTNFKGTSEKKKAKNKIKVNKQNNSIISASDCYCAHRQEVVYGSDKRAVNKRGRKNIKNSLKNFDIVE